MSQLTLDPAAASQLAWTGEITDYDDGDTPDDDTTFLANTATLGQRESFRCSNVAPEQIPNHARINYVELQVRARATAGTPAIQLFMSNNSTSSDKANDTLSTSYADLTYRLTADIDGNPWTPYVLRNWLNSPFQRFFGVVNRSSSAGAVRVTRMRIVVDFDTPARPASMVLLGVG
jgi:hypothetical protein